MDLVLLDGGESLDRFRGAQTEFAGKVAELRHLGRTRCLRVQDASDFALHPGRGRRVEAGNQAVQFVDISAPSRRVRFLKPADSGTGRHDRCYDV